MNFQQEQQREVGHGLFGALGYQQHHSQQFNHDQKDNSSDNLLNITPSQSKKQSNTNIHTGRGSIPGKSMRSSSNTLHSSLQFEQITPETTPQSSKQKSRIISTIPQTSNTQSNILTLQQNRNQPDFSMYSSIIDLNRNNIDNLSQDFSFQSSYNNKRINYPNDITIIGYPSQDISYIYRKFFAYGSFQTSSTEHNTLRIIYDHTESAQRALAEDGKWIQSDDFVYCISVRYSEKIQPCPKSTNTINNIINDNINNFETTNNNNNNNINTTNAADIIEKGLITPDYSLKTKIIDFLMQGW